jgi:hypothetical protein
LNGHDVVLMGAHKMLMSNWPLKTVAYALDMVVAVAVVEEVDSPWAVEYPLIHIGKVANTVMMMLINLQHMQKSKKQQQ